MIYKNRCISRGRTIANLYKENRNLKNIINQIGFEPDEIAFLQQENTELKKQLEENKNPLRGIFAQVNDDTLLRDCGAMQSEIDRCKTQQKEFIDYLEDEIKLQETIIAENQEKLYFFKYEDEKVDLKLSSQKAYIRRMILEEVLQKYKSIIGVSDENNNK